MIEALRPAPVRLVGGAVRDSLLGLPASDLDLCTPLPPGDVLARLEAAGVKAIPTGIAHGTVTAIADGQRFEVTTLRRDVATDGRRAVVAFTDDWREDAARRDFTINALSADPDGTVHDYFGGFADLAAQRVRFIGDPVARIREDGLRILRFFRFHARFGGAEPDADGLAACTAQARALMALSRERIRDEWFRLLEGPNPVATVALMQRAGILATFLPETLSIPALERLVALETHAGAPAAALRRLAALVGRDAAQLDDLAARLKCSNAERKRLAAMSTPLPLPLSAEHARAFAYKHGAQALGDALLLAASEPADLEPGWNVALTWAVPRLPFTGKALLAKGLVAGPAVGAVLQAFEQAWIAADFPSNTDDQQALLAEALSQLGQ
jgi:poly(A) polymerase